MGAQRQWNNTCQVLKENDCHPRTVCTQQNDRSLLCLQNTVFYLALTPGKEHKEWFETVDIPCLSTSGQCQDHTMVPWSRHVMLGVNHKHDWRCRNVSWGSPGEDRGSLQKLGSEEKMDHCEEQNIFQILWQSLTLREQGSLKKKRRQMGSVDKKIGHRRIYEQLAKFPRKL